MTTYYLGDIGPGESREIDIASLKMSKVAKELILKIRLKGIKTFKTRLWLGRQLLKLSAMVIGCGIEIES
jgi:hypothetical protein